MTPCLITYLQKRPPSAMRRSSKDSPKLSAESQRLVSISQAIVQAGSRVEERTWERNLDSQLQKLLKTNHQERSGQIRVTKTLFF